MLFVLRKDIVFLLLLVILLPGCNEDASTIAEQPDLSILVLEGKKNDTAYLFVPYTDEGATVNKYFNGTIRCPELVIWANVSGSVNTNMPGTYVLEYNASDSLGVPLAPISRTVQVIENSSNFLSGIYKVACTCTAITGSDKPIITTENYTAVVNPAKGMGHFQLVTLSIGPEHVIPQASLNGSVINVGYFGSNYTHFNALGTLSDTKNAFTIETQIQRYSPATRFLCKNVFTKLLTIKTNTETNKK